MKTIETHSNWCYIDRLDGKDIEDGESVRVEWPDGTITAERLRLKKERFPYNDHGHTYDGDNWRAYIEVTVHGLRVEVWLRDTAVKLERSSSLAPRHAAHHKFSE